MSCLPKFEGIKRPHTNRKGLTDLLGPLRRWLQSQVGRPWNDVYSEACAVIKPDSVIRAHVKTHLLEFVERNTFMHEGKVCVLDGRWTGEPILLERRRWRSDLFFVHPDTGLLQVSPQESRRARLARRPRPPETFRWIGKGVALKQIRGLWYECRFQRVSKHSVWGIYDYALEKRVEPDDIPRNERGHSALGTGKRQLSRVELRSLGLRNVQEPAGSFQIVAMTVLKTALRFFAGRRLPVILNLAEAVRFRSVERSALV